MKNRIYSFLVLVSLLFMGQGLSVSASQQDPKAILGQIEALKKDNFHEELEKVLNNNYSLFKKAYLEEHFIHLLEVVSAKANELDIELEEINWQSLVYNIKKVDYNFFNVDRAPERIQRELCKKKKKTFSKALFYCLDIDNLKTHVHFFFRNLTYVNTKEDFDRLLPLLERLEKLLPEESVEFWKSRIAVKTMVQVGEKFLDKKKKINDGLFDRLLVRAQKKNEDFLKDNGMKLLIEFTKKHLRSYDYFIPKKCLLLNFMAEKIKEADDCKIDYEHVVAFSTILLDLWNPFHFLNNKKRKIHFERKKEIEEILCKLGGEDAVTQLRKLLYWGYVKDSFVLLSMIIVISFVILFYLDLIYAFCTDQETYLDSWSPENDMSEEEEWEDKKELLDFYQN